LQQRELDVVQREISVLLKEQTLESQIGHNKKKKGKKELDFKPLMAFEPTTLNIGVLYPMRRLIEYHLREI